jgi:hypothetical protein
MLVMSSVAFFGLWILGIESVVHVGIWVMLKFLFNLFYYYLFAFWVLIMT